MPKKPASNHPKPITRRDATGHLDPKYERDLLKGSRENRQDHGSDGAFICRSKTGDELGEALGEAFVQSVTSGEEAETERQDRVSSEEQGGPFVPSTSAEEFASGTDGSNLPGATREPFPKTSG